MLEAQESQPFRDPTNIEAVSSVGESSSTPLGNSSKLGSSEPDSQSCEGTGNLEQDKT